MKIIWLCNIALPDIANALSLPIDHGGGWMIGALNSLKAQHDIELIICFPIHNKSEIEYYKINGVKYCAFPQSVKIPDKYNPKIELYLKDIVSEVHPNIIHIWGTEYPHTLSMINVGKSLGILEKIVISIQGLCSICAHHYYAHLPSKILNKYTIRDFIKQDNIRQQRNKFIVRGKWETEALAQAKHIIGRTTWDFACSRQISPNSQYYFCNETVRDIFYGKNIWNYETCERQSIFMTQGTYPIKGLHNVLLALPFIINNYPNVHLNIAGIDITKKGLKKTYYAKYLLYLINKYNLHSHITFLGYLDDESIYHQFIKTNVYLLASSIENSPNSLGEAMLLGVPCVSSNVGGVSDMLVHNSEGYLFQSDAVYMLAFAITELFGSSDTAKRFSAAARSHALETHDRIINHSNLLNIYKKIRDN